MMLPPVSLAMAKLTQPAAAGRSQREFSPPDETALATRTFQCRCAWQDPPIVGETSAWNVVEKHLPALREKVARLFPV